MGAVYDIGAAVLFVSGSLLLWFLFSFCYFSSCDLSFFSAFFVVFSGGDLVALCVPGWLSFSLAGFRLGVVWLAGVSFPCFLFGAAYGNLVFDVRSIRGPLSPIFVLVFFFF